MATDPLFAATQSACICCVFFAAWCVGKKIHQRLRVAIIVIALIVASTTPAHFAPQPLSQRAIDELTGSPPFELPAGAENTMPPQNRDATFLLAASAYVFHAKIVDYVDADGRRTRFTPKAEDIKRRDKLITSTAHTDDARLRSKELPKSILSSLLVAALLGYCAGLYSRSVRA